jgi:hypothetical protein
MGKAFERLVLFFPVLVMTLSFVQTAHPSSFALTINTEEPYSLRNQPDFSANVYLVVRCTEH